MRFPAIAALIALTAAGCQTPAAPAPETAATPVPAARVASTAPAAEAPAPEPAPGSNKPVPAAALLVPGRSAGGTRLGESYDSVAARLGRPDASDAAMGKSMATWYAGHSPNGHQTAVFFARDMGNDETARVRQIRVTSPYFKTAEGLGVGAPLEAISQAYRVRRVSQYEEAGVRYQTVAADGILFEIDPQNRCTGVIVARRGDGPPYLSFHPDARLLD